MSTDFFSKPILNSPYVCPSRYWELDENGQPTNSVVEKRRPAEFITPIPKPKKRKTSAKQESIIFDEGKGLSTREQEYNITAVINGVRDHVDAWRQLPNPSDWQVTPETARLLQHWRHHKFSNTRPFFCQVEAVETAIWLTEVAPNSKAGKGFLDHLVNANNDANPGLSRLALKLATGAGKTTVMAMLIAWHTINAVRRPNSKKFTRGFLVVTPGLTIKDRLRVLQPNDPDSYYRDRELVLDAVEDAIVALTDTYASAKNPTTWNLTALQGAPYRIEFPAAEMPGDQLDGTPGSSVGASLALEAAQRSAYGPADAAPPATVRAHLPGDR